MVTYTVAVPASPTSPYNRVYKYLNTIYLCNRIASMNGMCAPGTMAVPRTKLTASAPTTATSPTCQFNCTGGCGTITIDSTDGLPVELMGFEVSAVAPQEGSVEVDHSAVERRDGGSRAEH